MFEYRTGSLFTLLAVLGAALALVLASADRGQSAGQTERYVVRAGDTLWSIADARYDGDLRKAVWRIRENNELSTSSLVVGDVLELPAA